MRAFQGLLAPPVSKLAPPSALTCGDGVIYLLHSGVRTNGASSALSAGQGGGTRVSRDQVTVRALEIIDAQKVSLAFQGMKRQQAGLLLTAWSS